MTFSERQTFLLSIKAAPDEDLPRLAFADWLEEHKETERAELVRLGVELRGLVNFSQDASVMVRHFPEPRKSELVHAVALQGRERKLAAASTADWLPAGFGYLISTGSATKQGAFIIINSGIGVDVLCPWVLWRKHGDAIWERELPWRVRLTTYPEMTAGGDIEFVGHTAKTAKTFRYRIAGRVASLKREAMGDSSLPLVAHILRARWPGIEFELPPVMAMGVDPAEEGGGFSASHIVERDRLDFGALPRG